MYHEFIKLLDSELVRNQQELAFAVKSIIYKRYPKELEHLDIEDDSVFLEPTLFTFLSNRSQSMTIEQILFGYRQNNKSSRFEVHVDGSGIIYLPNCGYFQIEDRGTNLKIGVDKSNSLIIQDNKDKRSKFFPIYKSQNSPIEVTQFCVPLYESFFLDDSDKLQQPEIIETTRSKRGVFDAAIDIYKRFYPEFYAVLEKVSRTAVIFNAKNVRSFATKSAHGVGFFNALPQNNEVFFLAEIAHQYGHVILNSLLTSENEYIKIDKETPLRQLNGVQSETRTFHDAFHGLFTTTMVAVFFEKLLDDALFDGLKAREIAARLADNHGRFLTGMERIKKNEVFENKGLKLYDHIFQITSEIYDRKKDLVKSFDLSNRNFVFDFDSFSRYNPVK